MDEMLLDLSSEETQPSDPVRQPISGTYVGERGMYRLELRLDLAEQSP
jgi:hypothetical protein